MPKNVKGASFEFINIHSDAKFQKNSKGGPFGDIKNFRKKVAQCRKNPKGDPLGTSGFVGFLGKIKNERGTLWTKFALALGGFRIVSKKWTDQCEDCSLKKKVTAIVGHFSLKGKCAD